MKQEGLKFYRCNTCGNLFLTIIDPNITPTCCGSSMEILEANKVKRFLSNTAFPLMPLSLKSITTK